MEIDFVVTWVDGSDLDWQTQKNKYSKQNVTPEEIARYRDYGTLKYWFRMIEKNAPWVNNIYLITCGQIPNWLNLNNKKLKLIFHEEYMPKAYLPTFNSAAIEINVHRIKELSEHFVLFNDDTFLVNPVDKEDFFINNVPRLYSIYNVTVPTESFARTMYNNTEIINKYFKNKKTMKENFFKFFSLNYRWEMIRNILLFPWNITGYINLHLPLPHLKSTISKLWSLEYNTLDATSKNKFRNYNIDINHYLASYFNIENNLFEPARINNGKTIEMKDIKYLEKLISKYKMICVNDSADTTEKDIQKMLDIFKNKYPEKSSFEI